MSKRSIAYAHFAEESYSWRFIERPALNRAIPASAYSDCSPTILDIGSGSGRVVNYHIKRGASEVNILGIDPDETNIKLSSKRFPKAHFSTQKIQKTTLKDNSLDIVTAQLSLRYLSNDELMALYNKVSRALRQGGIFFILDTHPTRYGVRDGFDTYFQEGKRTVNTPWGGSETYYYRTIGTYVTSLAASELTILGLDECPIAKEGLSDIYNADLARYSTAPVHFAITATK